MSYLFGGLMIATGLLVHVYVSFWAFFVPFTKPEHAIRQYFPSRWILIVAPVVLAVLGFGAVATLVSVKAAKKSQKPKSD